MAERRYSKEDLLCLRKDALVKLVERQLRCWPELKFNPSKTTVAVLRSNLLNYGFTKNGSEFESGNASPTPSALTPISNNDSDGIGEALAEDLDTDNQPWGADVRPATGAQTEDFTGALEKMRTPQPAVHNPTSRFELRLLIEDHRMSYSENGLRRTTELVTLSPTLVHPNGDWDFRVKDMLWSLQHSNASISVVKLAYPDPGEPDYNRILLKMKPGDILEDVPSNPSILTVSALSSFKIIVEHATNGGYDTVPTSSFSDHQEELPAQITNHAEHVPASEAERDAAWLKGRLEAQPGYEKFRASQHRKLKNFDRVDFWAFAAKFSADYNRAPWPNRRPKKINKVDIGSALGMKVTALAEAENATRIIRIFGSQGTQASQDVIKLLERDENVGSYVLFDFLRQWEIDHSLADSSTSGEVVAA
ncbi:hypothetical protein FPV67DRAFT_1681304 [Lyophyllum atratum]|nr:hypothetical protein FPV67DRAFT_1681304 [Lyophyllum atratum]